MIWVGRKDLRSMVRSSNPPVHMMQPARLPRIFTQIRKAGTDVTLLVTSLILQYSENARAVLVVYQRRRIRRNEASQRIEKYRHDSPVLGDVFHWLPTG